MRDTLARWGEAIHLTALGVWAGAVFGAGVSAAVVFPTMRSLDPTLGAYPGYAGEHWMLGAGRVAARVFLITDGVQFACATLAIAGFALARWAGWQRRTRSWAMFLRALALGAAFLLVSYHLLIQAPRMDRDLRAYWDAAEAGDNDDALVHQRAFADRHPGASRVLAGTFATTTIGLALGAWSLAGPRREGSA